MYKLLPLLEVPLIMIRISIQMHVLATSNDTCTATTLSVDTVFSSRKLEA